MTMKPPIERRQPRNWKLAAGRILGRGGDTEILCTIRDVSESGAKVYVPAWFHFPATFSLQDVRHNEIRQARVVWRKEGVTGLQFTGQPRKGPATVLIP
jgi:hypothetical protein